MITGRVSMNDERFVATVLALRAGAPTAGQARLVEPNDERRRSG
jgi:hypothetical protein